MILSMIPVSAIDIKGVEPLESVKQRVSNIYHIPMDVMDTLDEAYIRDLDVDYGQVLSTKEEYVKFTVDEQGETTAIFASESEYLHDINKPSPNGLVSDTDENSWMRIYLVVIDQGSNIDISSTYTWLTLPRITARAYDLLSIRFENGTYEPNSASGFYSYKFNGATTRKNLTGFKAASNTWKQINCAFQLNDGAASTNHFAQMKVTLIKNTGAGAERAMSTYGHQEKAINWTSALGGAVTVGGVAAAFTEITTLGSLTFISGIASILGSASNYYDAFSLEVFARF